MLILSRNIFENKLKVASVAALILVPLYTWKTLYSTYKYLQKKYAEELIFYQRHNCVIMYAGQIGMRGWPPYSERITINITSRDSIRKMYEPLLYFINTAEKRLDVAFMMIGIEEIIEAFLKACRRGVKVRIILNLDHYKNGTNELKLLKDEGIEVTFYVNPKQDMNSIMHYKYMVKDYSPSSGYVLTGSMNLSKSAFISNYEDIVITSNQIVAEAYQKDFAKCWEIITSENENVISRVALMDANWLG